MADKVLKLKAQPGFPDGEITPEALAAMKYNNPDLYDEYQSILKSHKSGTLYVGEIILPRDDTSEVAQNLVDEAEALKVAEATREASIKKQVEHTAKEAPQSSVAAEATKV